MVSVQSGRTPRGVRGLKLKFPVRQSGFEKSHSARGAWIETDGTWMFDGTIDVALREGCVD